MQRLHPPSAFGLSMPVKRDGFSLTCGSKPGTMPAPTALKARIRSAPIVVEGQEVETIA
jgi:hypothetical protein